jgi:hypothetical protein
MKYGMDEFSCHYSILFFRWKKKAHLGDFSIADDDTLVPYQE